MTLNINPSGSLAHYRVFIYLKWVSINNKREFLKTYMQLLISLNFDLYKEEFIKLVRYKFGEMPMGDFYIGWIQRKMSEGDVINLDGNKKEVSKDFNDWYHQGYISFGKKNLVGNENKFFVWGYNAAKQIQSYQQ